MQNLKVNLGIASLLLAFLMVTNLFAIEIINDDFDQSATNLAGWKRSSTTYVYRYTGTNKIGLASMTLISNSWAYTLIKTSIFTNLQLKFSLCGYSLESGEAISGYYSTNGGSSWILIGSVAYTNGITAKFYNFTKNIPNCNILGIKFAINGNSGSDYGYVDNIVLTGVMK